MKRRTLLLILVLFIATAVASGGKGPVERFDGSYDWSDGGSDELSALFTPDGDGSWKVKFSFRFSGKKNDWKGRATGSLDEGGKIEGTAGWSGRSWEFEAMIEDGVMRGTHTEIRSGDERYESGSFELSR